MAQLIVKVKRLNKRTTVPELLPHPSSIIGVVEEGFQFEGVLVPPQDIRNPAMGTWYRDRDGYVYWGGGLTVADLPMLLESAAPDIAYPWWLKNQAYSIPDMWDNDPNPNVRVAILDTGINQHVDFNFERITGYNFFANSPEYKEDIKGHGTHLAGIIAGNGKITTGVFPSTSLYIAKISNTKNKPVPIAIKNALQAIYDETQNAKEIDIINMSFHLSTSTDPVDQKILEDIKSLLQKLTSEKNCVLIGACGDHGPDFKAFPASMEECLSVGAISSDFVRWPDSSTDASLDIMAPGVDIKSSSGNNGTDDMSGTSQSAAIISGICALGINELKKKNISRNSLIIRKTLIQTALNSGLPIHEYGHGTCNPNAFIQNLKNLPL